MHRGFCTDCGAYAALGENDRCAACDAWRHREEERAGSCLNGGTVTCSTI